MVGAIGTGSNVETKKPGACAVFKVKVTLGCPDKTVLTGGSVQKVRKIQRPCVWDGLVDLEMLLHTRVLLIVNNLRPFRGSPSAVYFVVIPTNGKPLGVITVPLAQSK
jgi:hypothetical protein